MQSFFSTSTLITLLTLSSPFLSPAYAAKPSSLTSSSAAATATGSSTSTNSVGSTGANSGSLDSVVLAQSSSSSAITSSSTSAAKSQWIQINTPMGKITSCSTIMLSWTSGGVDGPLEIDLVSATTGDIITVLAGIDPSKTTSYKWTVAAAVDTYYLQGNAADFPSLIYSGNFTISQGSSTSCLNKQAVASSASAASGSAVKASATVSATPSSGSTFVSGAERAVAFSGLSVVALVVMVAFNL